MQTHDVRKEFQGGYTLKRIETKYLVVHHAAALYRTATGIEDVRAVARYHTQSRGWPGIGYHVALAEETNSGPIAQYTLSALDLQRAHVWGRNHEALGVSCLTNFTSVPERKWIEALAETLADLLEHYPHAQIVGHCDIAFPGHATACPGPSWPLWRPQLLARVSAITAARLAVPGAPGAPTGAITEHTPIVGGPLVTQAQVLAYLARRPRGVYTATDLRASILPDYWSWCLRTGVSFGVAIAQMIHETGGLTSFWSQRPQRNPAGIGVTGRAHAGTPNAPPPDPGDGTIWRWNTQRRQWETGLVFSAWTEAIPAHVVRLLGYARADSELPEVSRQAVDRYTARRPLPAAARGSATTLRELGAMHNRANVGLSRAKWRAGWAWPGERYGEALAAILRDMQSEVV